jgi:hypothetical protein
MQMINEMLDKAFKKVQKTEVNPKVWTKNFGVYL